MSWLPQVAVGMLGLLCRIEKHVWRDWRRPVDEANNGREGLDGGPRHSGQASDVVWRWWQSLGQLATGRYGCESDQTRCAGQDSAEITMLANAGADKT